MKPFKIGQRVDVRDAARVVHLDRKTAPLGDQGRGAVLAVQAQKAFTAVGGEADGMAGLPLPDGPGDPIGGFERGQADQRVRPDQGQVAGQDEPAACIGAGRHRGGDAVPHVGVGSPLEMPGQPAGADRLQHVVEHRLPVQEGLQFVAPAARGPEPPTAAGRQHQNLKRRAQGLLG